MNKSVFVCDEHDDYFNEKCFKCFIENLCEHIEFRNGSMVIKKAELESD